VLAERSARENAAQAARHDFLHGVLGVAAIVAQKSEQLTPQIEVHPFGDDRIWMEQRQEILR
jgi:hypothetical protein